MWNWIRKLPHPGYKKCGGASRDCSDTPARDWMDLAFEQHDKDLAAAKTQEDRNKADKKLAAVLREGDPKKLGLWGRVYRRIAMIFFRS